MMQFCKTWFFGGRLAFMLSLLIHTGLTVALLGMAKRPSGQDSPTPVQVDVVALESDTVATPAISKAPGKEKDQQQPVAKWNNHSQTGHKPSGKPETPPALGNLHEPFHKNQGSAFAVDRNPGAGGHDSVGSGDFGTGSGGGITTFFQIEARGRDIVYVIDRSMSMGRSGGLNAARRELLASLRRLPVNARFQIIAYHRYPEPFRIDGKAGLFKATEEAKFQALAFLKKLRAEGGTDHCRALKEALLLRPDEVFFLTDADDLTEAEVKSVTGFNRTASGGRCRIHTIELNVDNRDKPDMPLQALARENRGTYQAVALKE